MSTAERGDADIFPARSAPSQSSKPPRVLACVLCQQRKVKCDRKYPCGNCLKSRAQCVPATQVTRRRRRRFPERELLERLHKYEDLLRQNNIKFNPLHKDTAATDTSYDSDDDQHSKNVAETPSTTANSEVVYGAKNMWHAMSYEFRDPNNDSDSTDDDVRGEEFKKTVDEFFENNDHLLVGSRKEAVDISTLHPEPVQIFRLWQTYLDNVNPLLKVTHTPSLQGLIIEAAGDVLKIKPALEALMFGIYCMAILSLSPDDCQAMFGTSRVDLLTKYQFGCQQALFNCRFLRSSERDCLTALYLYLISVRPSTDPPSLSSMLGIAIRIAQRMGIDSEAALARCTVLEAELRRRLWWSLVLFDTRMSEMADSRTATLNPTWNCELPLNVNDSDLHADMKEPPQVHDKPTDALFAVVRSDLGNFIRHTTFHLDFSTPALKPVAKDAQHGGPAGESEVSSLETRMEEKYLGFCDPDNPLHFMIIWSTRGHLAKCRLVEHHSKYFTLSAHQPEAQRDAAMSYALRTLECDTKLMRSPLARGFLWYLQLFFPFPAYIQIIQSLKRRPVGALAERAWEAVSDNYEARFGFLTRDDNIFYRVFGNPVAQAWQAREAALQQAGEPFVTPNIVLTIRRLAQASQSSRAAPSTAQASNVMELDFYNFPVPMPAGPDASSLFGGSGGESGYLFMGGGLYPSMTEQGSTSVDFSQLDWSAMDWNLVNASAGEASGRPGSALPF